MATTIEEMLGLHPRRHKLSGWQYLHPPRDFASDWSVVLPFRETFALAFERMCPATRTIGLRDGKGGRCYTFLSGTVGASEPPAEVVHWGKQIGTFVGIRDTLPLSFALDYDCVDGDPAAGHTELGETRSRAKPYGGDATPENHAAALEFVDPVVEALSKLTCMHCDALIAMPPSDPDRSFNLPSIVTAKVAERAGIEDLSSAARTTTKRPSLKSVGLDEKLATIEGTIEIDASAVQGRKVVILDDLYQSGVTMNYLGAQLLAEGVEEVSGLAFVKTCRNDDNTGGGS